MYYVQKVFKKQGPESVDFFSGISESFFDVEEIDRIGKDGIYGAQSPNIEDEETQVTNNTREYLVDPLKIGCLSFEIEKSPNLT